MNLRELSEILGLSQTTVSRALNGYPEVAEETRRRVREAATTYNYHPNNRARSLATGRSMSIGHVIPVSTQHEIVNPIFTDFISGAGEAYAAAGYDLTLKMVSDGDEDEVYRDLANRGSVDGVIVHGPRVDDRRIAMLSELGLPFVVHGRATGSTREYSWLDVNNRRAFYRATSFLIDFGHRRIGLINGIETMDFATRRRTGYREALEEAGIVPCPELIAHGEMTERHGYASARQMLNDAMPPTAFVVASVICAIGVRRAVQELGLIVGRDVSIVIYDDDLSYFKSGDDIPVFTAVRSSVREAGRNAANMLLDIIAGTGDAPRQRLMEAELTVGSSTGPAPDLAPHRQRG
ncbi:substrate-binding domain-containing protein [Alphaproteobacteria bacterium GH1-50]|uniref:Substrate-binding domain-containing protein n=1 Tax=Kangsaoukella pontilimi TaxID=2691042 RepID=A0A7C9IPJ6_9RHOB|nr:substrate-binding domain-containing protein [Kangsaoukella pontilimi]MXQ06903.1 substrate-binding domain-containing protein [Kangsaoukella pontilimi]